MASELPGASEAEEFGPISSINVTPFVDVVLVLLVIFMVTAPLLMKDTLGVHLPKAASADTRMLRSLGVTVTRQGQILVNGELASPESVGLSVKQALAADPQAQAIIRADQDARHGDVVRAIDWVKSAGLSRFAIQVER